MGSRTNTTKMRRSNDARVRAQEGRDGAERVRSLRGKIAGGREKREERMNRLDDWTHGIEASQDHDDKEKREERREKREERREKREERREQREERREKREERRKKREERRQQRDERTEKTEEGGKVKKGFGP